MSSKNKIVMVFGVFDGLHPGHEAFLKQARKVGRLIAVVARDSSVKRLKGHLPGRREAVRARTLDKAGIAYRVVLGDRKEGEYKVLRRHKPDVIVLGYDQKALAKDILKRIKKGNLPRIKIVIAKPFKPRRFHSSLLNSK